MKTSLQYKLFAAMLLATLSVVIFMTLVIQWSFDKGFLEYVNIEEQKEIGKLAKELEEYYAEQQTWQNLQDDPVEILTIHAKTLPEERTRHRDADLADKKRYLERLLKSDNKKDHHKHPIQRIIILDGEGNIVFGTKIQPKLPRMIPIMHNGQQVGSVGLYMPMELSETNQLMFVEKQTTFIFMACLASMAITVGISMLLAYSLAKPIKKLSFATRQLTEGDYSVRVQSDDRGEVGKLSSDISRLAETLEENERLRQLWVSDIAHELRTPLTSLKGQIEALQDGIRQPDQKTYDNLHKGVMRLERLVEDLYDLSRSDLGTFTLITKPVDLHKLIDAEVEARQHEAAQANLSLTINKESAPVKILGDPQRLQQLIGNLLTNSLRYTDGEGKISVAVQKKGEAAILEIEDTAPGVPDEALPQLFNRLYRVEQSRNRVLGGSGLGLAICQQIVHAHDGTIKAQHGGSGGLRISVSFPLYQETVA